MKTDEKTIIIPDFMIVFKTLKIYKQLSLTALSIKTDITYSHLHMIKKILLSKRWLEERTENRKK